MLIRSRTDDQSVWSHEDDYHYINVNPGRDFQPWRLLISAVQGGICARYAGKGTEEPVESKPVIYSNCTNTGSYGG